LLEKFLQNLTPCPKKPLSNKSGFRKERSTWKERGNYKKKASCGIPQLAILFVNSIIYFNSDLMLKFP